MKIVKIIGKIFSFILLTAVMAIAGVLLIITIICRGPSQTASDLFVVTILETGNLKFLAQMFFTKEEIDAKIAKNSLIEMTEEVDEELIEVPKPEETKKELIEVKKIIGNNYEGTLMIVSDPSKVSLATTYPWGTYGKELKDFVEDNNAIAAINGGLYHSANNLGGRPIGVTVSNGVIQDISDTWKLGMHLVGFDKSNVLKIINIYGKSEAEVRQIVKEERIRDAVCFLDAAYDRNNHFVKLIVNGQKRQMNGLGSGSNPRTVIGQRKDGTVLLLVTDGRGKNGHLGANANDLIEIMSEYGAVNAANIDGGSSSAMYYKDRYIHDSVTLFIANKSWRLPTAFIVKE